MKTEIEIPAKEWNAEKGKMEDTSLPEWQKYYADLRAFREMMEAIKPKTTDFKEYKDFNAAYTEWMMACSCDAPNKPGYTRANND